MNSSCDTSRPVLRLLGLIASMVAFAFLWSGDQRIQQEIAASRAPNRPVYAGPAVLKNIPASPRMVTKLAIDRGAPLQSYALIQDQKPARSAHQRSPLARIPQLPQQ